MATGNPVGKLKHTRLYMRYSEIRHPSQIVESPLEEAPKKPQFGEEKYGSWTIKYRIEPKNGKYDAAGMNDRNPNRPMVSGQSSDEAIANVKKEIDRLMVNDEIAAKYTKGQINLNAEFTRDYISDHPTGVRLVRRGDESILILCDVNFVEELGTDAYGPGADQFTRLQVRVRGKDDIPGGGAATLYGAGISVPKIKELGLRRNGRYSLIEIDSDPEYGHQQFKLIFDSETASVTDKMRLHQPGLTLAVY
jgi:hypothetical protein